LKVDDSNFGVGKDVKSYAIHRERIIILGNPSFNKLVLLTKMRYFVSFTLAHGNMGEICLVIHSCVVVIFRYALKDEVVLFSSIHEFIFIFFFDHPFTHSFMVNLC